MNIHHFQRRWITRGPKSNFICDNILTKAILFFFGCSEVNSTWLISSELANQRAQKVVFTCVLVWYILTLNTRFALVTSCRLYVSSRNFLLIKRSQWLPWSRDSSNTTVFLLLRSYRGACFNWANYDPVELSRTTLHLWQHWMTCKDFLAFKRFLDSEFRCLRYFEMSFTEHLCHQDHLDSSL